MRQELTPKQAMLVEGIVDGKSYAQAALDAGYSAYTANQGATVAKSPTVKEALRKLLPTIDKIAERINEGMDATKTIVSRSKESTELHEVTDFAERRNYTELSLRLHGLIDDPKEAGTGGNVILIGNSQVAIKEG